MEDVLASVVVRGEPGPGRARCARCRATMDWLTPAHFAALVVEHERACKGSHAFVFE